MRLARRNEALEDFAALVAHELKASLQAALLAEDASEALEQTLDLVDAVLESAQEERSEEVFSSAAPWIEQAVTDWRPADVELTSDLRATLPIAATSLAIILRNLVGNAAAAGARHVHVSTRRSGTAWRLDVEDDGVGPCATVGYAGGSGLGFGLCQRIASRFGGSLELSERPYGGARATLALATAPS